MTGIPPGGAGRKKPCTEPVCDLVIITTVVKLQTVENVFEIPGRHMRVRKRTYALTNVSAYRGMLLKLSPCAYIYTHTHVCVPPRIAGREKT